MKKNNKKCLLTVGLFLTANVVMVVDSTDVEAKKRSKSRSHHRSSSGSSKSVDRIAPTIKVKYDSKKKVNKLTLTISANESGDKKSGIKKIEIISPNSDETKKIYKKKFFSFKKNSIEKKVEIKSNGTYTIIATDKKGNQSTETIIVNNIK